MNKKITLSQLKPVGLHHIITNDFILKGNNITLIPVNITDIDFIYNTYNNKNFMELYNISISKYISKIEITNKIKNNINLKPTEITSIEWIILDKNNNKIGLGSLVNYQKNQRKAEFLLGFPEKNYRVSTPLEAALLIFDFSFNKIEINKIISFIYAYNRHAQNNTLHLGFKQEGYLEHHFLCEKGFIDIYQNGLLRSHFKKNIKLKKLSERLLMKDITSL